MAGKSPASILEKTLEEVAKEEGLKDVNIVLETTENAGYFSSSHLAKVVGRDAKGGMVSLNMFVKHVPKHEGMREETPVVTVYHREIHIYTRVFPALLEFQAEKGVTSPFCGVAKCYKTCEIERNEFLILEDLNRQGFSMCDKTKPMSNECVEVILREYGKFHALSLAFRDQRPETYNKLTENIADDFIDKFTVEYLETNIGDLTAAISCFDAEKENNIIQFISKFASEKFETVISPFDGEGCEETVILHGDCWCNNYMFLFEDVKGARKPLDVKLVDWQLSTVASPILDISFFVYSNASSEVFSNLQRFLKIYHDSLSHNLKELGSDPERMYPLSVLMRDWRRYARVGIVAGCMTLKVCYSHLYIPDLTEDVSGREFMNRFPGDNTFLDNPMYKQRVRDLLLYAEEAGLLNGG